MTADLRRSLLLLAALVAAVLAVIIAPLWLASISPGEAGACTGTVLTDSDCFR